MFYTLLKIVPSAKEKQGIRCSHCFSHHVIQHGTYPRRDPETETEIRIQRYLCKAPECPWRTFSILPFPILPIVRHAFHTLLSCHCLSDIMLLPQAVVARRFALDRVVIGRLTAFGREFMDWFEHERKIAGWGLDLPRFWSDFTRDFSQRFYPRRWGKPPPTQHVHLH